MHPDAEPGRGEKTAALQGVLAFGTPLREALAVVILVHGRGASAQSMRPLAEAWARPGLCFLAPDAAQTGGSWYPHSFLAPLERNQPYLNRALERLERLVTVVTAAAAGHLPDGASRLMLAGFSQGACLAAEFTARHARRYGGLAVLSGGLIGPPGAPRDYPGTLDGTPVFLGCSDVDPHIPRERVLESEMVLRGLGGQVTTRLYPGLPHTINEDEIESVGEMIEVMLVG